MGPGLYAAPAPHSGRLTKSADKSGELLQVGAVNATTAIVWFRRDLRLSDQPALRLALERHPRILPVYIHAPEEEGPWAPGGAGRWWLHHALAGLGRELARAGAPLLILRGESLKVLRELARAVDARGVYWNRLYEPALVRRDQAIKQALREDGLEAESGNAALLVEPWQLKTGAGEPYRVFTPFWRAHAALPRQAPLPAVRKLHPAAQVPPGLALEELELLPKIPWDGGLRAGWDPGEAGAWALLERWCGEAAGHYRQERDQPALDASSRLSPHLHFGEISPAQITARLQRLAEEQDGLRGDNEHYLRELGWREFAHHLLYHYPHTPQQPLHEKFANFPWRKPQEYAADLRAWQQGKTGVELVDAGMRQLWHSGWMHNRVRMIAASFLTKNLLIPWQEGAKWFWDTLVDADLANNTLGWQWTAGCGADAAPYFRVFNPLLQAEKFDPQGIYRQRWLPPPAQRAAPIVDLAESRRRALEAYGRIKAA
jgi:deoxyribodipyrimidine photo-lyase